MSRSCRHRSCPPACSTSGDCPPTIRAATTTQVLNPLESDRPQLATTLLPGLLEALGRNVSRGAVDVALFAIAQVVEPTSETRAVERIPNDRRPTDEEIAMLDASLPRQPQHVGVVLAGLREPAGPWGPGRPVEAARRVRGGAHHRPRRRRRADTAGRAVPAVASRPLRRGAGRRQPFSSGTQANCIPRSSSGPACRRAPARSSLTSTPSRSPRRCLRLRCRRSRRSSRTSA